MKTTNPKDLKATVKAIMGERTIYTRNLHGYLSAEGFELAVRNSVREFEKSGYRVEVAR